MATNNFTTLFNSELTTFFAKVDLGPVVEGGFIENRPKCGRRKKLVPDLSSLKLTDRPLGPALFFNQELIQGRPNPLYGMASHMMVRKLFQLYARQSGALPNRFLKPTPEMREFLPGIIAKAEQNGKFDSTHFRFAEFSSLVVAARVRRLMPKDFESLASEITAVYGPLFPDAEEITLQMVIDYQLKLIDLALTNLRAAQAKEVKAEQLNARREKVAERTQRMVKVREILQQDISERHKDKLIQKLYQ